MAKKKKNPFRSSWKDYFTFSRREKSGMYVLLFVFMLQIAISFYLNYVPTKPIHFAGSWIHDTIMNWKNEQSRDKKKLELVSPGITEAESIPVHHFRFNPNNISGSEMQKLGLSERQIAMIIKYRSYGSGFKTKNDFGKLYCITAEEFQVLEPWIDLPDSVSYNSSPKLFQTTKREPLRLELNQCDTLELDKLPGIGPAFARRIVNYRKRLGSYYDLAQLNEVWGMTDTLLEKFISHLYLDVINHAWININSVSIDELGKHPYVGFPVAKVIVSYRDQHGSFTQVEELKNVPLVTDEMFRKLAPYLEIESQDSFR